MRNKVLPAKKSQWGGKRETKQKSTEIGINGQMTGRGDKCLSLSPSFFSDIYFSVSPAPTQKACLSKQAWHAIPALPVEAPYKPPAYLAPVTVQ